MAVGIVVALLAMSYVGMVGSAQVSIAEPEGVPSIEVVDGPADPQGPAVPTGGEPLPFDLTLNGPATTNVTAEQAYAGRLASIETGTTEPVGIPHQNVTLLFDGQPHTSAETDSEGYFNASVQMPEMSGVYPLEAIWQLGPAEPAQSNVLQVMVNPIVHNATPEVRGQNATAQTIMISGFGFQAQAECDFGEEILVTACVVADAATVNATLSVDRQAPLGLRTFTVSHDDNTTGSCESCFLVTPAPRFTRLYADTMGQGATEREIRVSGRDFQAGLECAFGPGIEPVDCRAPYSFLVRTSLNVSGSAVPGHRSVTFTNPDAGTETCWECFKVTPAPVITSVFPETRGQGARGQHAFGGEHYQEGAACDVGDDIVVLACTAAHSGFLRATVEVDAEAEPGSRDITVTNPDFGTRTCHGCFEVTPRPTVSSIEPDMLGQGAVDQEIVLAGKSFEPGLRCALGPGVRVRACEIGDSGNVTVQLSVSRAADTGVRDVIVVNPDGGRDVCDACFEVAPGPRVDGVEPGMLHQGDADQPIDIMGAGFRPDATCDLGKEIVLVDCTFLDEGHLVAMVDVPTYAVAVPRDVVVTNGDGGVGACTGCFHVGATSKIDPTTSTTTYAATQFLYTGENPRQQGMDPSVIDSSRAAVIRGQVRGPGGEPLAGVNVTVLDRPEFGQTTTNGTGMLDMVVNGGGDLTLSYMKPGFLPVQRQVHVLWGEYSRVDDVLLVSVDEKKTAVDLAGEGIQVHVASPVEDDDGNRTSVVMVPEETNEATMTLDDGSQVSLSQVTIQSTEYTVGDGGPARMPADLPSASAYTYAVELTVEEALGENVTQVEFDSPVINYVDNFLDLDAGEPVPVGFYDRDAGKWVPESNGLVIHVMNVTDGLAMLDVTGDGSADSAETLETHGITAAEQEQLAGLYDMGDSFWRVSLDHFSAWDYNWPFQMPDKATRPKSPPPQVIPGGDGDPDRNDTKPADPSPRPCDVEGSIIECLNQVVRDAMPLEATDQSLHISSRAHQRARTIEVQLTDGSPPEPLSGIVLDIRVAGQAHRESFSPGPDLKHQFVWDGKDAYGREMQGTQPVSVQLGYVYQGVMGSPAEAIQSFGRFPSGITGDQTRQTVTLWQSWSLDIGDLARDRSDLGGWSLTDHHLFDPASRTLIHGDGTTRDVNGISPQVIDTLVGGETEITGYKGIVMAPNGTLFVSDRNHVVALDSVGATTIVAGTGTRGFDGDGGPATEAELYNPLGLALGPDGTLYIAESGNNRVRAVDPNGTIRTFAGTGSPSGPAGDGGPATEAAIRSPSDVAVGPDGTVYITQRYNHKVSAVDPTGIINTFAGGVPHEGWPPIRFSGDGGFATDARLNEPRMVTVGQDGVVYIADTENNRVRTVDHNGRINTIAGGGSEEEGTGTNVRLRSPMGLAVSPNGSLFIAENNWRYSRVVVLDTAGNISIVAGTGEKGKAGEGGPATEAELVGPTWLELGPDGGLLIVDDRLLTIDLEGLLRRYSAPTKVAELGLLGGSFANGGVAAGADGTVYITDPKGARGQVLREVAPDGTVSTTEGLGDPAGLTTGPDGTIYYAYTFNHRVMAIDSDGTRTIAGTGPPGSFGGGYNGDDRHAATARLSYPRDVVVGPDGTFYIADSGNHLIRAVDPSRTITTIAGIPGRSGGGGDGHAAAAAHLNFPTGLAVGPDGTLYISDTNNHKVRAVDTGGTITTVAGTGQAGFSGDGGDATQARLNKPGGLDVAPDGTLYIADTNNHRIRAMDPTGVITTIAGAGVGFGGDGGPAMGADFSSPGDVAVGPDGSLYVADRGNDRVRQISSSTIGRFGDGELLVPSEDGQEAYVFNVAGRHLETVHTLTGETLRSFDYDNQGRLSAMTDGDGNTLTVDRDGEGDPIAIVAPFGQRTEIEVDENGYIGKVTNPAGEGRTFNYTDTGLLVGKTDALGREWNYDFDEDGFLVGASAPNGRVQTLNKTFLDDGTQVVHSSGEGHETVHQVEVLPNGAQRYTTIDPAGDASEVVRADGAVQANYADGLAVEITYGPDPRFGMHAPVVAAQTTTTPDGRSTTVTTERAVELEDPSDPFSVTSLTTVRSVGGQDEWRSTFYAENRTVHVVTPEGRKTVSTIDGQGRVIEIAEEGQATITADFDQRGRLRSLGQGAQAWTYSYNEEGWAKSFVDAAGNQVEYAYDAAGRATEINYPDNSTYTYGYDDAGNWVQLTGPGDDLYAFDHDELGDRTGLTPPGNPSYTWTRDLDRRTTMQSLPSGRSIEHVIDGIGRPTTTAYPEANVTYEYLPAGKQPSNTTWVPTDGASAQSVMYEWDADLVQKTEYAGPAAATFTYEYDDLLRLSEINLQVGDESNTISIDQDQDGLMTRAGTFAFTRNGPGGAVTEYTDGNYSVKKGHDGLGRPVNQTHQLDGNQVQAREIVFDETGRIVSKKETILGDESHYTYAYDAVGRLVEVRQDGDSIEEYTYDARGNRVSRTIDTGPPETATYDGQDRIKQQGNVDYSFDEDGFLVGRDADAFTYSAQGELLSSTVNGERVDYGWDAMNRMVTRTTNEDTTMFLYGHPSNPFLLSAMVEPDGLLTVFYYDDEGFLMAFERGDAWHYVVTDQVGTPILVLDEANTEVRRVARDTFGGIRSDSNPDFYLPIGFAGGLEDPLTGLVRFGFRDYDLQAGRWTSRDPVFFAGGQENLYVYVGNNPVSMRDPFGLWCIGGSAYGGIGLGVKICRQDGETTVCGEVGLGLGGGVSASTGGGPPKGNHVAFDVNANCGPGAGGVGCRLDDCGVLDCSARLSVPGMDDVTVSTDGDVAVTKGGGGKQVGGCKIGGNIRAEFCR